MSAHQRPDADSITVYVRSGASGTSYHEREGCHGAFTDLRWTDAVDAGLEPCKDCASSFRGGEDR